MNKTNKSWWIVLAIALGSSSGSATADFSGAYDVSRWRADGVAIDMARGFVTLYHQGVPMGESGSSFFLINAAAESSVSFNWEANVVPDDPFGSPYGLSAGFDLNDRSTVLAYSDNGSRSGSFSQHVHAGEEFGFFLCCSEHYPSLFNMRISNFNVTAVPEPETYAMFFAGLGLMGFMARRRKQVV